jgi:hypothetical protein
VAASPSLVQSIKLRGVSFDGAPAGTTPSVDPSSEAVSSKPRHRPPCSGGSVNTSSAAETAGESAIDLAVAVDLARIRLITFLNHCHHFPGFVYQKARLCPERGIIEIAVRPRRGAKPVCSGCHQPTAGYDHLGWRRFEFVPFWGFVWCC